MAAVLVFLDNKNLISNSIHTLPGSVLNVIFILGGVLIFLFIMKYKIFKNILSPLVNRVDFFVVFSFSTLILFRVTAFLKYSKATKNIDYVEIFILLLGIVLLIRDINVGKELRKKKSTVVDLKQILDNKIDCTVPFFVREDAVGYDLFNRSSLVTNLLTSLKNYTSSEKFVVSLEGRWGSGKTTFLNNLIEEIKDDDFIIIDDFEPWLSESKESLLRNLLNTILMQSNLDISRREIDIFIKTTSELVLGKKYVNPIINAIENVEQNYISNITSDINYMIDRQGKKILFIIDNLDRLKPDSVYLVLNIVNNILNFHNLIVILSYDRDELENGLRSINISSKYLDKIIQQKLVMPPVKKSDRNNIYSRTIRNLLDSKHIEYNIEEVNKFSKILSDNQVGLRDFKRFLNSSIIPFVLNARKITIIDYLVIEFIRIYDGTLYEDIYRNPSYFISSDIGWENSFKYVNSKKIDQEMNDLFKNIGIEDNLTGKLLQLSFPFVENYLKYKANYKNTINDGRNNPVYQNIQKNKRISSGKFFDLYFTKDTNPDANMIDLVSSFVEKHQTQESIQHEIDSILDLEEDVQIEYLSNLSLYVEEMSSKQRYIRGELFLKNYFMFEDFKGFLILSTKNRLALVISELLEGSEQNEFENLFHDYIFEPKYLTMVSDIRYWFEHSVRRDNKEKLEYIDAEFKDSIERILSQKVNLFERNIYIRLNALQIYFYLEKINASSQYKEYLQYCMNEETYFRILSDLVGITEGSRGYSYAMRDNFENMVDVDLLKDYNGRVESVNEKQDLLKEVFENQLSGIKDEYGDIAIRLDKSIDLGTLE